ncbi:MAG: hypothetical protein P8Y70_04095 [Candidatus Lokiarchaeota archaeon]
MNVKVFQFNGCDKCFNESLLLMEEDNLSVELITDLENWKEEEFDIAVITGYLLPENETMLMKIFNNSEKIIAYGSCPSTGGIYGLANQKGFDVTPIDKLISDSSAIHGCLANIEDLKNTISNNGSDKPQLLCTVCKRKSTCDYLDEVHRQIELEDKETCFNDLGFLCNGYVSAECKEKCINYETQCRGCTPIVERPGIRMLGMFGTLMGNIEVATEASKYGATDKLADKDDDITKSLPDIVGNFFRFSLPSSGLPKGRIPAKGSLLENVFVGRLIEELPLITGLLGGTKSISLTLNAIESYEKDAEIDISEETKNYRKELRTLEKKLEKAVEDKDVKAYKETTENIRKIAGNMNLSNVFFGGFKTPIKEDDSFDNYKPHVFEIMEGNYKDSIIEYSLDSEGVINEIKLKEGK